jgi:pyridinium-3,5-bisthiocarboxylic acid mononucleotide nickel chelatase
VEHEPEHSHRHLHHIEAMIDRSSLCETQKALARKMFLRLAEAEAKVHGSTIEKVHFHEVGAVDSIADIVGSAIAWDLLGIERAVAAPVPTGAGFVEIAHGRCSIPAPATAELLRGVPLAPSRVEGELTTPTGATLLATLVDEFGPLPPMRIESIGYGAGQKDFDHPNLLRLLVGEATAGSNLQPSETITLLETNLDDCTGENIGHCAAKLWEAGAIDVSLISLQMKKNRPGTLLQVQCPADRTEVLAGIIFRETTTLGLRRSEIARIVLPRREILVSTSWGEVSGIVARLPDGTERFSPEHESCREIADKNQVPLAEVLQAARLAFAAR